jgi:GNAT superfamily N-acetyltransferase
LSSPAYGSEVIGKDHMVRKKDNIRPIYSSLPCILIGRVAVVRKYERHGIGTNILNWAVGLITNVVCKSVGCRYITVDPKTESLDLYLKSGLGFTRMEAIKPGRLETRYYINLYKHLSD